MTGITVTKIQSNFSSASMSLISVAQLVAKRTIV